MNIDNKLKLSHDATSSIHIFKEGIFAKMYNESAYLFCKHFVSYKVNVTTRKKGNTYFSIGFPLSLLSEKFRGNDIKEVDKSYSIVSSGNFVFDATAFKEWCGSKENTYRDLQQDKVSLTIPGSNVDKSNVQSTGLEKEILKELYDFRLEAVSPMECMLFISQIQKNYMAHYQNLPLFKAIYDLLIYLFTISRNFQKDYRYTIGENIKKRMLDMIVLLYKTNSSKTKSPLITELREHQKNTNLTVVSVLL